MLFVNANVPPRVSIAPRLLITFVWSSVVVPPPLVFVSTSVPAVITPVCVIAPGAVKLNVSLPTLTAPSTTPSSSTTVRLDVVAPAIVVSADNAPAAVYIVFAVP